MSLLFTMVIDKAIEAENTLEYENSDIARIYVCRQHMNRAKTAKDK